MLAAVHFIFPYLEKNKNQKKPHCNCQHVTMQNKELKVFILMY